MERGKLVAAGFPVFVGGGKVRHQEADVQRCDCGVTRLFRKYTQTVYAGVYHQMAFAAARLVPQARLVQRIDDGQRRWPARTSLLPVY